MVMSALPFWLERRRHLEELLSRMTPEARQSMGDTITGRLIPLEAIIAPEVRPGNGLENVLRREALALQLEELGRIYSPATVTPTPYEENADGCHPGMVFIPGGPRKIGSPNGFFSREEPERELEVDGFWIDIHAVTNLDYHKVIPGHVPDRYSSAPEMPVIAVTWYDAHRYAAEIGKRLPTAIEWETAARSPHDWLYSFGPVFDRSLTHVWPADGATEVYQYPRAASGTHQMCGNVWEWTRDIEIHRLATGRPVLFNLVRGGSWRNCPAGTRATISLCTDLAHRSDNIGFRCVLPHAT